MATEIPMGPTGFPSHFISPQKKETKEYALAVSKYADGSTAKGLGSNLLKGLSTDFSVSRAYGDGSQPIDKYKPILGIKQRTKKNPSPTSYKVLSWEILPIMPKFVNLLLGRLINQNNDIGVKAIDKWAQDERRKTRTNLQEYILNKDFLDSVSKSTGIGYSSPVPDDVVPPPQNMGEIDIYMDMFYKERYCLVMQDWLTLLNDQDNYPQVLADCARDLITVRIAATKTYRVGRRIKRRRCVPERMVSSVCQKDNFEDADWIGEYWDLSIGELKEIAGQQFTEDEYKQIAEKSSGSSFGNIDIQQYYNTNLCYPWDATKITVLDLTWFSPNDNVHQVKKNNYGNVSVFEKEFEWWKNLQNKGVTEKSFNKENENQVIVQPTNDQYGAMWIRGTEFVFNYGKSRDMLKNESDIGTVIGPYCIQSIKRSIVEMLIPVLDNIQINWLQYQHHAAKSRPAGLGIEFSSLQDVSIEGAGGKKITPKEALELYFDTGILLWRRKDASGQNSNFQPVSELTNNSSDAMERHFNNVIKDVDLLRGIIGENELTDASTPNSEMGKAVANMATDSSRDAQRYLHFAFDQLNLGTQKRTIMNISGMAATGLAPDYAEALGEDNVAFTSLMSDMGAHEYGAYLMKQPTQEMRARLAVYCQTGIAAGTLYEEEAFEIENEPNIYRAINLLKVYRKQKLAQKQQQEQGIIDYQSQSNIQTAQASEAARQQTMQMEMQAKVQYEWEKAKASVWQYKQTVGGEAFLIQVKGKLASQQALSEEEMKRVTLLANTDLQGQYQLEVADIKSKQASKARKSA